VGQYASHFKRQTAMWIVCDIKRTIQTADNMHTESLINVCILRPEENDTQEDLAAHGNAKPVRQYCNPTAPNRQINVQR
jgi:hypothetical protein